MEIGTVKLVNIEDEMRGAYIDYAMSVITARALPDVRDGLKPVQRRILYAMSEIGLHHNTPYKKSARIVGEVLGKYHPHGDASVYEAMVRLAQNFSMRYPLVDGQGNFGSVDGDPAAAMRYTEARMAAIAEEMLADIDKNTVNFAPNFDGTLKEPTVLPAKLPNLLLNGSSGIAVGMATNIPPHNLNELVDGIILIIDHFAKCLEEGIPFEVMWPRVLNAGIPAEALVGALKSIKPQLAERVKAEAVKLTKKPNDETRAEVLLGVIDEMVDIPPDQILEIVKGPDFPTAGLILGHEGIKNAYMTGHGRVTIRARAHIEEMKGNRHQIIVTELPYQVNKASLLEKIAELVRDKRIEGISELRDESDRQGMRIVIELRRDTKPTQVLNQLFKYTAMQSTFSINMLALVDGQPRVLTLKMILLHYINFRKEVITRRTIFDLERARHRAHILQGLKIALDNLDEVISTIRKSRDADTARTALMKNFKLSEVQAQAILDMQLRRLAALERKKILDELAETLRLIGYLEDLLAHPGKMLFIIKDELNELKGKYGDARRTRIAAEAAEEFTEEDLIPDQEIVITVSAKGYVKRVAADSFRLQRRAKAIAGTVSREEDAPQILLTASTLDQVLFVTNRGRAYQVKGHELPDASRQARGLPLSNFFTFQPEERAIGAIAVRNFDQPYYVLFVTRNGDVKRVALSEYSSARAAGINAINVGEGDEIAFVGQGLGKSELLIVSEQGQAIRFNEDDVRASGRTSGGIRAIRLKEGDRTAGASMVQGDQVVVVTRDGFHKRTALSEFPAQSRGGGGVRAQSVTAKTGPVAGTTVAAEGDEVVIVSSGGLVLRSPVDAIPVAGRATQGTPLAGLEKNDKVALVARVEGRETPAKPAPTPSIESDGGETETRGKKSGAKTAAKPGAKSATSSKESKKTPRQGAKSEKDAGVAGSSKPVPPAKVVTVKTVAKVEKLESSAKAVKDNKEKAEVKTAAKSKSAKSGAKSDSGTKKAEKKAETKKAEVKTKAAKGTAAKAAPAKATTSKATTSKPTSKAADSKAAASKTAASKGATAKKADTKGAKAKTTTSRAVETKTVRTAKAKQAEPAKKSLSTATARKATETPQDERFTRRIVIAPPAAPQEPAKPVAGRPMLPKAQPAALAKSEVKEGKSKSSTLFGSIASSVGRSLTESSAKTGEAKPQAPQKQAPKAATRAQASLPLFGETQEDKKTSGRASKPVPPPAAPSGKAKQSAQPTEERKRSK